MTFTWEHAILWFIAKTFVYIRMIFGYVFAPFVAPKLNLTLSQYFIPWTFFEIAASVQGLLSLLYPIPQTRWLNFWMQSIAALCIIVVPCMPGYDSPAIHTIILSIVLFLAGYFNNFTSAILSSTVVDFAKDDVRAGMMSLSEGGWCMAQFLLTPAGIILTKVPLSLWFCIIHAPSLICAALTTLFYPKHSESKSIEVISEASPLINHTTTTQAKPLEYMQSHTIYYISWWFLQGGISQLIYSSFGIWLHEDFDFTASEIGYATLYLSFGQLAANILGTFYMDSYGPAILTFHCLFLASLFLFMQFLLGHLFNRMTNEILLMVTVFLAELCFLAQLSVADKFTPKNGQSYITIGLGFSTCGISRALFAFLLPYIWNLNGMTAIYGVCAFMEMGAFACSYYQVQSHPTYYFNSSNDFLKSLGPFHKKS